MNTALRRLSVIAACSLALTATACGDTTDKAGGSDDKLKVVTAFYPFQYVASSVAGDKAEVTSLTAPGAEPHDLELTPKQIASLAEADLVVYQKGFQEQVDKALEEQQPKNVVDVAQVVDMQPMAAADDHEHEGESAEEHEGHDHGSTDPHTWLAPTNMVKITAAVQDKLKQADSADAATFDANAKQLSTQLTTLDKDFSTGLSQCTRKEFITSHAAFGYLAKSYGLTQIGISGLSPDEQPSPARITEVQKLAKEHGVTTIFYETLVSPAQAKSIAGDLGLKTDVLDPLEGITKDSRGSDYIAVQRANLAALKTANGCK